MQAASVPQEMGNHLTWLLFRTTFMEPRNCGRVDDGKDANEIAGRNCHDAAGYYCRRPTG